METVRPRYRYPTPGKVGTNSLGTGTCHFRLVRYDFDTRRPGTEVRSATMPGVRVFVRYGIDTRTRHSGKWGTNLIPVPDTSVTSV